MSKLLSGKALVVQIGEQETRVAGMTLGMKLPQVQETAVLPTPAGAVADGAIKDLDALSGMLAQLRLEAAFKKYRKVLFILSSTQVIVHNALVPKMKNTKKLEQMIRANSDMYFPVDVSDYQLTWQVVGDKTENDLTQTQVQLWAIPNALLLPYYRLAESCGLSVAAIDYCGHSFASGINATFAAAKPAKPAKKSRKAKADEVEAAPEQSAEQETTTLYINLEKDHMLMSFVQEDQVLLQRLLQRSEYLDTDLNDLFMEMEYFHSMFPTCVSGDCVISGSCVEDVELVAGLEEVAAVPLKRLHCTPDQIWCMCLGASISDLDFGDASFAAHGKKKAAKKQGSGIWQYAVLALAAALLTGSVLLYLTGKMGWDTELQGLRDTQMMLQIQSAATNGYAEKYNEYAAAYDAYSSDWDNIFQSVRTYNDNAGLILEELEGVLPKDAVVTNLTMNENSISLDTAFQDKEDVVYFLIALRGLEYASLDSISNLQELHSMPEQSSQQGTSGLDLSGVDPSLLGAAAGLDNSTLQMMLNAYLGSQKAPTEGSYEAPPTEGDVVDDVMANEDALKAMFGGMSQDEMLNSEAGKKLTFRQKMVLVQMKSKYDNGLLDTENLTAEEEDALRAALNASLSTDNGNNNTNNNNNNSNDNTNNNGNGGGSTGGGNSGSAIGGGSIGGGSYTGGTTGSIGSLPTGEELIKLLEKYDLTEQDLIDGLDNLVTTEFGVLDVHYVKPNGGLYETYTLRYLLANGATLAQRQTAIRALFENNPLALHQFFILMQEDKERTGDAQLLMDVIHEDFWTDADNNRMIYESDQAMLDRLVPGLINMLVKNEKTVKATENLIRTHYNLTRKLTGELAEAMGKEYGFKSDMSFSALTQDILTGKTKQDLELNNVVYKMLTPTAKAYYDTIQLGGIGSGNTSGSTGSSISDLINQLLGGNTGTTGGFPTQEPAGNFAISVTLGYKDALIQAEQVRKGLDYDAKIEKVEVAG